MKRIELLYNFVIKFVHYKIENSARLKLQLVEFFVRGVKKRINKVTFSTVRRKTKLPCRFAL